MEVNIIFNRAKLPNSQADEQEKSEKSSGQTNRNYPPLALSVEDMAEELSVSDKTAYWLVHQPGFPSVKVKGRFIVNYKKLQEWLDIHSMEVYPEEA